MRTRTPDLTILADAYGWAAEHGRLSVAVIDRVPLADVLRAYGADLLLPVGRRTFAELCQLRRDDRTAPARHMSVAERRGRVVVLENGFSSSHPEVARRCSAGTGRFCAVDWEHGFGMVTQAAGGRVTASFASSEPLSPDRAEGEVRPDWAIGPAVPAHLTRQTCLALLELQTGFRLTSDLLAEPRPAYQTPDPYLIYEHVPGSSRP